MKKYAAFIFIAYAALCNTLFPDKLAVLPETNNPSIIDVSGSELYVLDEPQVLVYSLKDYRLLTRFGKSGEGPGELITPPDVPLTMKLDGERVLLNSVNKMIIFSKSGKMLKEIKAPLVLIEAVPLGKNYVVTSFTRNKDGSSMAATWILNQDFKEGKKIYETDLPNNYKESKIAIPMLSTFPRCSDNKIFLFDQQKEFKIKIFDQEGNPLPGIEIPYRKIKTSDSFKNNIMDTLRVNPAYKRAAPVLKKMIYIPEYLPDIRNCQIEDRKLYIHTYRTKGELSEFYILDFNGKVIKKVFLPGADRERIRVNPAFTYVIRDNKYYYLLEDIDREQWELHVEKIE